jgi:hypothetical protein
LSQLRSYSALLHGKGKAVAAKPRRVPDPEDDFP